MARPKPPKPYGDPRTAGPTGEPKTPTPRNPRKQPTLVIESGHIRRAKGVIRHRAHEMQSVRYVTSLQLDLISAEVLKLHAYQRRVSQAVLVSDILNLWLGVATDYNQALFRELLPRGARAADVPERWAGYLASLGFAPVAQDPVSPAPPLAAHDVPPPAEPAHPSPPVDAGSAPDGHSRPGPETPPPAGSQPADAVTQAAPSPAGRGFGPSPAQVMRGSIPPDVGPAKQYVAPPQPPPDDAPPPPPAAGGWGNAAQAVDLGFIPSQSRPEDALLKGNEHDDGT